jgi:hypothetical protein
MRVQGNTDRTLIGVKCRWPVAQPARQDSCALRCRKTGKSNCLHFTRRVPFRNHTKTPSARILQQRRRSYVKQPASILHQDSKTTPTNTLRLDQTCGSATRKGLRDVKSLHLHSHLCGERFIGLSRPTASRKVLNKYLVDKTK